MALRLASSSLLEDYCARRNVASSQIEYASAAVDQEAMRDKTVQN